MEQIREILKQLALHLELNIAMCDKIESLDKRLSDVEASCKANKTKLDGLNTTVSNVLYKISSDAYEARKTPLKGK